MKQQIEFFILIVLFSIAGVYWVDARTIYFVGFIGVIGFIHKPSRVYLLYKWKCLGISIQKITAPILLSIVYLFILTPLSFLQRLSSSNKMKIKKPDLDSYFEDVNEKVSKDSIKNPF